MKLFEFARALETLVPGVPDRQTFWREFIARFTTVKSEEFGTEADPTVFISDETFKSMNSRDSAFTAKIAKAIMARLDEERFIDYLMDLDPGTQILMISNLREYGVEISLENFAYETTQLLVSILREKAGIKKPVDDDAKKLHIFVQRVRYKDYLLARSQGCASCKKSLTISSHKERGTSFKIVYLETSNEVPEADDFAVLCTLCAEKYELEHTQDEVEQLRSENQALTVREHLDDNLAPLHLDSQIRRLLKKIHELPLHDEFSPTSYSVHELAAKIDERGLLRKCRDLMANYEHVVRQECKALESAGELDFGLMCVQIKYAWLNTRAEGVSQEEVWDRLTAWVHKCTEVDLYASGILVTFMIQICEVFAARKQEVA